MYPRNAASPEPIAIGAVVLIATGAVQTSGVTVRIKPIGVAEGDGAGTTAYSTDGIVEYTPTQAETNYTSFILIAKKASCIPVAITVVTTASATPGRVTLSDAVDHGGTSATLELGSASRSALKITNSQFGGHALEMTTSGVGGNTVHVMATSGSAVALSGSTYGLFLSGTTSDLFGTIGAANFDADAIDANALATDAVSEIQSGLSTHAAADVISALASGTEVFGHSYLESIKRIEVKSGSKLSGAGTGTEIQTSVDAAKTVTWTVDGSGNITDEVWA